MALMSKYDLTKRVYASNDFVDSEYFNKPELDLTVKQRQFIFYLLSKVDKDTMDFPEEQIKIADYCELFNIDWNGGRNKKLFRESITELVRKAFFIKINDHAEASVRWLGQTIIDYDEGTITTKIDESMRDYFIQLKNYYFSFQLGYITRFKSKYSYDLYMVCNKNCFKRKFYLSIDDVRQILCKNKKIYPRFYDLLHHVLQPAIKEINQYSDLKVEIKTHKTGNKITEIFFYVKKKSKKEMQGVNMWKALEAPRKQQLKDEMDKLYYELDEDFDDDEYDEYDDDDIQNPNMEKYNLEVIS